MFLSEDGFEVVRVDCDTVSIPFFRIDVPLSSKSIWFGTKMTRMKPDNKIELREILRPLHLSPGQYLSSRKILKVFMICNNIDKISWTFQVVSSNFKSFKNGNKFLIIHIVVQLHCGESIGVEDYQMNFIFFVNNGKDSPKHQFP